MKRSLPFFLLLIVALLVLSGCFEETSSSFGEPEVDVTGGGGAILGPGGGSAILGPGGIILGPGETLPDGETNVIIIIRPGETGEEDDGPILVEVPDVVGKIYGSDVEELFDPDYFVIEIVQSYKSDVAKDTITEQFPAAGSKKKVSGNGKVTVTLTVSMGTEMVKLPDFSMMEYRKVGMELDSLKLHYEYRPVTNPSVDVGYVLYTEPAAKSLVATGSTVIVYYSAGSQIERVKVPVLTNLTPAEAYKKMGGDFRVGDVTDEYSDTVPEGCIISQSLPANTDAIKGTTINFVISLGPDPSTCHHYYEETHYVAATCTSDGRYDYICIYCGLSDSDVLPAMGHSFTEMETVSPTCHNKGYVYFLCEYCGERELFQELMPIEHTYEGESFDATCQERAHTDFTCTMCGHTFTEYYGSETGNHSYTVTKTVKATCSAVGKKTLTCSLCGDVTYETIPALAHTYQNGVCKTCGTPKESTGLDLWLNDDGSYYWVIGLGSCTDDHIVLPAEVNGIPVERIDAAAFGDVSGKILTLSRNIGVLGNYNLSGSWSAIYVAPGNESFSSIDGNLYSLDGKTLYEYAAAKTASSFTVPKGVTSIGDGAFVNAESLTSISLPSSLTSIGAGAFAGSCLTAITIPESVTWIGDRAFASLRGLTEIVIPATVTKKLGNNLLEGCENLRRASLLTKTVPARAFYGCGALEEVTLSNDVTDIGGSAFEECRSLKTLTFTGKALKTVGNRTFWNCINLTAFPLKEGMTTIGDSAFYCSGITGDLVIPDSVTALGEMAFYGCDGLTSVVVGTGVTELKRTPFRGANITSLTVKGAITKMGEWSLACGQALTTVTLAEGTTVIGNLAFENCAGLTEISFPSTLSHIGDYAFEGCTGLTVLTLPDGVLSIGQQAFAYCTSLRAVNLGSCLRSLGDRAFQDCISIKGVGLPESLETLGYYVFDGCSSLEYITVYRAYSQTSWAGDDSRFGDCKATVHWMK